MDPESVEEMLTRGRAVKISVVALWVSMWISVTFTTVTTIANVTSDSIQLVVAAPLVVTLYIPLPGQRSMDSSSLSVRELVTSTTYSNTESPPAAVDNLVIDPVSKEVRQVVQLLTYVALCGLISLFGIGANMANIVVFVKQGFKESINMSLLGLAIADLGCLLTMFYSSFGYNPVFASMDLNFELQDVTYVSGGYPHVYFNRVTSFITVFITLERCLCIAIPLKVKNIITHTRTKAIIISVFLVLIIVFCPFYVVNKLDWRYDPIRNKTILGVTFTKDREIVESVTFLVHSVALSTVFLFSVAICTIILIVMLNKKTKWRQKSVATANSKAEISTLKEKKVVKMIAMISTIFVVCFLPASANFFMMTYDPEFSISGKLQNLFFTTWSVAFVTAAINSSVNIFVYFNMSTKFRLTFVQTFFRVSRK